MSSPPAPFPPSSAPGGTPRSSAPQSRPVIDPLAYDDVHGLGGSRANNRQEATEGEATEENGQQPRRQRAPRNGNNMEEIPRVRDVTGEKIMDDFQTFLDK